MLGEDESRCNPNGDAMNSEITSHWQQIRPILAAMQSPERDYTIASMLITLLDDNPYSLDWFMTWKEAGKILKMRKELEELGYMSMPTAKR
jgi:hypothetical protein